MVKPICSQPYVVPGQRWIIKDAIGKMIRGRRVPRVKHYSQRNEGWMKA